MLSSTPFGSSREVYEWISGFINIDTRARQDYTFSVMAKGNGRMSGRISNVRKLRGGHSSVTRLIAVNNTQHQGKENKQ